MKVQSLLTLAASAVLITSASAAITMDWVNVGNAGNPADTADGDSLTSGTQNYGAVAYAYRIGKYEVTNAQYAAFLNAADPNGANANGIYNTNMGNNPRGGINYLAGSASGSKYTIRANMGNKPVNYVSWYDAARFTNWLGNGQGNGSTETGAYTLSGNTGIILKNSGASVWLPSEDEWYKAAYYDPTPGAGGGDNYWLFTTQSNSIPTSATADSTGTITNPGPNMGNYNSNADWNGQDGNVTTVGSAAANNYFGTADQGGNVREWNDAVVEVNDGFNSFTNRGMRGGSYDSDQTFLGASFRGNTGPTAEIGYFGFRVASTSIAAVPEPSGLLTTAALVASSLLLRRRSKNSL